MSQPNLLSHTVPSRGTHGVVFPDLESFILALPQLSILQVYNNPNRLYKQHTCFCLEELLGTLSSSDS